MTKHATQNQLYDPAGNLTLTYSPAANLSFVYRYDHNNRLTGVYDATNTTRKAAFKYDALGRRIEFVNDVRGGGENYYYDGVNEIEEWREDDRMRYYVHGLSYVDERLMMYRGFDLDLSTEDGPLPVDRPHYYVLDRLYNVWLLLDRAGAIVERVG